MFVPRAKNAEVARRPWRRSLWSAASVPEVLLSIPGAPPPYRERTPGFQSNTGATRRSFACPLSRVYPRVFVHWGIATEEEGCGHTQVASDLRERTERTRDKKASDVVVTKSVPDKGPPVNGGNKGQPMSSPVPVQASGAGDSRLARNFGEGL